MCPGDGEGSGSTTSTGSPATRAGGGREGRSSGSPRGGGGGGAGQSAEPGRRRCHGRSVRGVSGERRWLPLKGAWRGGTAGGGRFRCRGPWAGSPADSATSGWACAGEGRAGNAGLRRPEAAPGKGVVMAWDGAAVTGQRRVSQPVPRQGAGSVVEKKKKGTRKRK